MAAEGEPPLSNQTPEGRTLDNPSPREATGEAAVNQSPGYTLSDSSALTSGWPSSLGSAVLAHFEESANGVNHTDMVWIGTTRLTMYYPWVRCKNGCSGICTVDTNVQDNIG